MTVAVVAGLTGTAPHAAEPDVPAAATPSPVPAGPVTQPVGLAYTVREARVGQWRIGPVGAAVTLGYQQIPVYRDGKTIEADGVHYPFPDGWLTFYRPGAYDIEAFGADPWLRAQFGPPRDVTIAGRPGIERAMTYALPDLDDLRAKRRADPSLRPGDPSIKQELYNRTAVAWKFDGGAWATFLPGTGREPLSRAESLAIVAAVRPGPAEPVRAPYRFGWLPAGWKAIGAEQSPTDIVSRVLLDRDVPAGADLVHPWDDYPAAGRLTVWQGTPKPGNAPRAGQDLKCADHNGYCTLVIDDTYFAEFERLGGGVSMADVRRILRGLTFTAVADRSTWPVVPSGR